MRKRLFLAPSPADLSRLLQAWRLWLICAMAGALLAALAYAVFPPPYRAQATVVVDHNLEQAWPQETDRQLFYYLERETRKLEAVAWADATLEAVSAQTGVPVADLRDGRLSLSQPKDGAWHFWADDPDPQRAAQLVSAWAEAFSRQVLRGVTVAVQLEATHLALQATPQPDSCPCEITALEAQIQVLESQSLGLNTYLQVSLSQAEDLPVSRSVGLGTYLFAGSASVVILAALAVFFAGVGQRHDDQA